MQGSRAAGQHPRLAAPPPQDQTAQLTHLVLGVGQLQAAGRAAAQRLHLGPHRRRSGVGRGQHHDDAGAVGWGGCLANQALERSMGWAGRARHRREQVLQGGDQSHHLRRAGGQGEVGGGGQRRRVGLATDRNGSPTLSSRAPDRKDTLPQAVSGAGDEAPANPEAHRAPSSTASAAARAMAASGEVAGHREARRGLGDRRAMIALWERVQLVSNGRAMMQAPDQQQRRSGAGSLAPRSAAREAEGLARAPDLRCKRGDRHRAGCAEIAKTVAQAGMRGPTDSRRSRPSLQFASGSWQFASKLHNVYDEPW